MYFSAAEFWNVCISFHNVRLGWAFWNTCLSLRDIVVRMSTKLQWMRTAHGFFFLLKAGQPCKLSRLIKLACFLCVKKDSIKNPALPKSFLLDQWFFTGQITLVPSELCPRHSSSSLKNLFLGLLFALTRKGCILKISSFVSSGLAFPHLLWVPLLSLLLQGSA